MKNSKLGLLIIIILLFLTGCNAPKTAQDTTKNEEAEIRQNTTADKDTSKTAEIDFSKKHVRPDGEYITLRMGEYLVGRDFKPGRYYLYKERIDGNDFAKILYYSEEKETFHYPYSDIRPEFNAPSAFFEEGQKIKVDDDSIVLSAEFVPLEDFYEVEKPEGTYVPKGIYKAGTDIPIGSYQIFPTSFNHSQCVLWTSEEAYNSHDLKLNDLYYGSYASDSYGVVVNISEGTVFDVRGSIYMKKLDPLTFD